MACNATACCVPKAFQMCTHSCPDCTLQQLISTRHCLRDLLLGQSICKQASKQARVMCVKHLIHNITDTLKGNRVEKRAWQQWLLTTWPRSLAYSWLQKLNHVFSSCKHAKGEFKAKGWSGNHAQVSEHEKLPIFRFIYTGF